MLEFLLAFIMVPIGSGKPSRDIPGVPGQLITNEQSWIETLDYSELKEQSVNNQVSGTWSTPSNINMTRVSRNAYFQGIPVYEKIFRNGMNCDFEQAETCVWGIIPKDTSRKDGSQGLTRVRGRELRRLMNHPHNITDATLDPNGNFLVFQAGYRRKSDPNHSYIESPWIEESLKYCTLSFYLMSTVSEFKLGSNDHAYMETMIVDDSNGAVPLTPKHVKSSDDSPWTQLEYDIGTYTKFKIEISFFKGVNESEMSIFGLDNIKLRNCLKRPTDKPPPCSPEKEYKCKGTGVCVSKFLDLCDYQRDCRLGDDEDYPACGDLDALNGGYRCDFSKDYCGWTPSGPMKWERTQGNDGSHFLNLDLSSYVNENLVTLGILRSPEFTPPPAYNEDDQNPATFQSCALRLFFKATKTVKVDFFEVEIIEKKPFTKVSRGSRVMKPVSKKMKAFAQSHADVWTKIEAVIPKGLKYSYFIQLNAVKGPDASGPAYYNMSMANITMSPQCFGLGVENVSLDCWRHDLVKQPREMADCMGVPYPEDTTGVFSYAFTTCAENVGPRGPWKEDCTSYYEYQGGNTTFVDMLSYGKTIASNSTNGGEIGLFMKNTPIGIQKWTAPHGGVFTVIAKGASGGHGRLSRRSSHGAILTALIKLNKDDVLYIVVGQEGQSACVVQGVESKHGLCSLQGFDLINNAESWISQGEAGSYSFRSEGRFQRSYEAGGNRWDEEKKQFQEIFGKPQKNKAQKPKLRRKEKKRRHKENFQSDEPDPDIIQGKEILSVPPDKCMGKDCLRWIEEINKYHPSYQSGGGGGGGATIIFKLDHELYPRPILVAGGGGGMADISGSNDADSTLLFNAADSLTDFVPEFTERGINHTNSHEESHGGHGGGWNETLSIDRMSYYFQKGLHSASGGSQNEVWMGGFPCNYRRPYNSNVGVVNDVYTARWGGYGGGGGGCKGGGGGGGFIGGSGGINGSENGYGGISFYDPELVIWLDESLGKHTGPGEVFIIPDIGDSKNQTQCKCHDPDSLCMALNEGVSSVLCYCKNGNTVDVNVPCTKEIPTFFLVLLVIGCIVLAAVSGLLCMCLYTQYQRRRLVRNKLRGPDGQLSMLRSSNGIMMTEYNPNYEFGGGSCSLMDLMEVDRDKIRLVKALGQGAFGEVYQGYFKKSSVDSSEVAVAVKTLPELSTNQAEMDFLMEALIMSKFNHSNIVQFIGVCFDTHPRFIILELLDGGDLKSFLRESRPKHDRPSSLTMRDLLNAAIDVSKGCSYLEENHFIHRDIAARNCLLTSKGPGRVVKIADFGMARDIYRADYYRKGGKAMLPVKWMPPEAFLDGIFTSKTDIWSFGILLWEVMSLGYMPYPGRGNQEVMQLVTNGGRLEPPNYCPGPLYGLMCQCWHPIPEERPTFKTIMERLGYCVQDPEVVMAPLPVFHRPLDSIASSRRDINEGNSSGNSGSGGSVNIGPTVRQNQQAADYLVPNSSSKNNKGSVESGNPSMKETSFTIPSASRGRGNYSSIQTDTHHQSPANLAHNSPRPSRWPSHGSDLSDLVSESKSTEPLLPSPASPSLDLEGIPPPPRPYPGPPPPIPPPPHPYKDHALPLNPSQLRMVPSSYANIGVTERGASLCENILSGKKLFPSGEISV